jgi:uncharacterized protein (TIGR00730 family)
MAKMRSVCIFCGTRTGTDPAHAEMAAHAGRRLARAGARLVYGGGEIGLQGIAARAALEAGGEVMGVIPEFMIPREGAQAGIELRKVATLGARKSMLMEEGDAFLILPGGTGTIEEVFDLISRRRNGVHAKPAAFADTAFWGGLQGVLEALKVQGFASEEALAGLTFHADIDDALDSLFRYLGVREG